MNKLLISTLAAFVLLATSSAFAQTVITDTAQHNVDITIPEVAFLRFTATDALTDTAPLASGAVLDIEFILDAGDIEGVGPIAPTNDPDWGDLKVFVNRVSTWDVVVSTNTTTFDWAKVGLEDGSWNLASGEIADLDIADSGWFSLGFGGNDFRLTLNGTELAGSYTTIVTYTLTTP